MPTGDECNLLSRILQRLSARFAAPEFPPHVTLLGGCVGSRGELIRKSSRLAAGLRPFLLRLEEIDFLDEYYRCLFVHTALTKPLWKAHQAACQAFGHGREPAFMPHLSLLYGNFPRNLKEDVIAEMGPRLDVEFKVRSSASTWLEGQLAQGVDDGGDINARHRAASGTGLTGSVAIATAAWLPARCGQPSLKASRTGGWPEFLEHFLHWNSEIATLLPKPVSVYDPIVRLHVDMSNVDVAKGADHLTNIQQGLLLARHTWRARTRRTAR